MIDCGIEILRGSLQDRDDEISKILIESTKWIATVLGGIGEMVRLSQPALVFNSEGCENAVVARIAMTPGIIRDTHLALIADDKSSLGRLTNKEAIRERTS